MKDVPDYSERTHVMTMKVLLNGTEKKTRTVPVDHSLRTSSAAVYALRCPSLVEWPVHSGAQDGDAVGRGEKKGQLKPSSMFKFSLRALVVCDPEAFAIISLFSR